MAKTINYSESKELRLLAEKLKARYINVVGYVDLDKIFFAFKGGDLPDFFTYEMLGLKNEWVKHATNSVKDAKTYCIAMTYDFYQKADGPLLQWTMLECLYSCGPKMDGKMRRKDVHEFSRFLETLEDLGEKTTWRSNLNLPELLGDETIAFALEEVDESI